MELFEVRTLYHGDFHIDWMSSIGPVLTLMCAGVGVL